MPPRETRDRNRHHGGALAQFAGDGGVAILRDGAHPFLGRGELERRVDIGQQRDHFGPRERQRRGADGQEAVAEGVDVVAVDVGDGAIGAHAEVAGHQLHADHGAGLEVGGIAHARVRFCRRPVTPWRGSRPSGAELRRESIERGAGESAEGDRRGDIDHSGVAGRRRLRAWEGRRVRSRSKPARMAGAAAPAVRRGSRTGRPHHVLDGPDAGDGIFGKRKRHGHRAGQLAIDIDRAAAHALHARRCSQRSAGEARQNERFLGTDVIQHAQDLHLEFLDAVPGEDRACRCRACRAGHPSEGKSAVWACKSSGQRNSAGTTKRGTQPLYRCAVRSKLLERFDRGARCGVVWDCGVEQSGSSLGS